MAEFNDILKRIKTGILLGIVVIFALWIDNLVLPLLLMVFITFATNEYFRFWHRKGVYPHTLAVLFPGYVIPLLFYFEIPFLLPAFVLFFFMTLLAVMRFPGARQRPNFLSEIAANFFGVFYISLLPSTIILLRKEGFFISLIPLVLTWLFDTFAYIIGSLLGRHPIAEKLSPKKTIEGTVLAFPFTFPFTYWLNSLFIKRFNFVDAILLTLGIGILGTVGDVFESGMKREVDLKDASKVFPGHGGFLDRMDSLIFNIPFFFLYYRHYG